MKKKHILNIAIILALTASAAFSEDANSLVQLDLRRSSDNSVDVTLVTSDSYGDNVMVRKKSDTKYVILVPKVKSAGYRASNLAGVNDLVSNIDVKTVDDTSGGYTKVTLITKKPLDIKTRTQKTSMSGSEQGEYNSLMAQANAVKNNISKREPPKVTEQKTEVTVNKTAAAIPKTVLKTEQKPKIELKEIKPENIEKKQPKTIVKNIISNVKKEEKSVEKSPVSLPVVAEAPEQNANVTLPSAPVEIEPVQNAPKKSLFGGLSAKLKSLSGKMPAGVPKALGLVLVAFVTIAALRKLFGKPSNYQFVEETMPKEYNNTIMNNSNNADYISNKDLTWREKYQLYLDKSAQPVKRTNKKGHYSFIKTPAKQEIEEKRQKLEKLVEPPVVLENRVESTIVNDVLSEDNIIPETVKFKAFSEDKKSLKSSKRVKRTSRFKGYETKLPLHEQPTINLEDSPLAANPRSLSGANLKVSDVDKRRITYEPKDYIMSSVDEYMSILDSEKEMEQVKVGVSKQLPEPVSQDKHMSGPINKQKSASSKNIIVKSSYKIAPKKGLYVIDKDGKNALVGKVNDKTFVLKKFDGVVTAPINVRLDNENVYMVKAGKFKSLVKVDDEKMGVLIEL